MSNGARLSLCIALGALVALLTVFFAGRQSTSIFTEAPPPELPRTTAARVVGPANDRVTAPAAPPTSDRAADPHVAGAEEVTAAEPSVANPFVAPSSTARNAASATRSAATGQPPAPAPSAYGNTSNVPLSWCFRETRFASQDGPAGLAPLHDLSSDTNVAYQGSASARIGAADGSLPLETVGVMWQAVAATPFRRKRVEVSAYARPRITRVGHFFVRTQTAGPLELRVSDQGAPGARGINQYIPRDADWDRYRVVHDVPADAEVMYYGFALFGGGNVWIDDIRISIVDKASAVSHYGSVAGTENIAIDPAWVLPAPLNLDFELTSGGPSGGPSGGAEASHPDCAQPVN